jgi:sugar phosphate isomerase/epimerase
MFTYTDAASRKAVRDDNRRALDEACTLDAACLVLVVGGLPGALAGKAAHHDIAGAREQVTEGIAALLDDARERRMPLAIEPLHPMYAADRACINTLEQALDVCDALDAERSGALGVAVDVYHVWWDAKLQAMIERAGRERLLAFHVCDWLTPTTDLLEDRGMMGDGVIDIPRIRGWVEAQGFAGYSEVEIFSRANWWQRDGGETLDTCIERHRRCV